MSANPKPGTPAARPIVNIDEVELQPRPAERAPKGAAAERFDVRLGMIAPKLGAQKLGYNITAVPAGKRAYPFHNHRINEEMFYVIEGTGEVRIGGAVHPIRAGDIIACPPGGKETAHQIVNTARASSSTWRSAPSSRRKSATTPTAANSPSCPKPSASSAARASSSITGKASSGRNKRTQYGNT
jgi:uncharacterized cupin superfamily protein